MAAKNRKIHYLIITLEFYRLLHTDRILHSYKASLFLLTETDTLNFSLRNYPNGVQISTLVLVDVLPKFKQGWVTIQDAFPKNYMGYLSLMNLEYIFEVCVAADDKITHFLNIMAEINVLSWLIDIDEQGQSYVYDNFTHLGKR